MNEQLRSQISHEASQNGWDILLDLRKGSDASSEIVDTTDADSPDETSDEDQDEDEGGEYVEQWEDDEYGSDYDEEYERKEVKEDELQIFWMELPPEILEKYSFLKNLPPDVALMGGTARSIAREVITGDLEPARDIDLIHITDGWADTQSTDDELDGLAQEYMADDYSHGHGIQHQEFVKYFQTRDFTINQSLVMDEKLFVSDLAYNDIQENIVRPAYNRLTSTKYELNSYMYLKALMLVSALENCCTSVPTAEDLGERSSFHDFDVALFLNKAMGRGVDVAMNFTNQLADYNVIPERLRHRPKAAAKWVLCNENLYFDFRDSQDQRLKSDMADITPSRTAANTKQFSLPKPPIEYGNFDEWDKKAVDWTYDEHSFEHEADASMDLEPAKLPHGLSPEVRKAIAEYDDYDYHTNFDRTDREDWDMPSPEEIGIPPLNEIDDEDDLEMARDYIQRYNENHSRLIYQIVNDTEELYSGQYSDADFQEINHYYDQSYHHPDYDSTRDRIVFLPNDGNIEDEPA